jgi:hypothetical protein
MSEAIWLAGTSRPQASKETPEDWLSGFLAEKRIKADWITSAHILIFRKVNQPLEWPIPLFPFTWDAAPDRAHYLLGAVCREIRAGEQDLVLMLEKDPKGWNASLLASPTFFGQRNRIPPGRTARNPDLQKVGGCAGSVSAPEIPARTRDGICCWQPWRNSSE